VKWGPPSLEIVEGIPEVGNTLSDSFFATVRASALELGNASTHLENTHKITTYW